MSNNSFESFPTPAYNMDFYNNYDDLTLPIQHMNLPLFHAPADDYVSYTTSFDATTTIPVAILPQAISPQISPVERKRGRGAAKTMLRDSSSSDDDRQKRQKVKVESEDSDSESVGSDSTARFNSMGLSPEEVSLLVEENNLKKQRLARKAALARASRQKKKSKLEQLEEEVALLRDELCMARNRALIAENSVRSHEMQMQHVMQMQPTPTPAPAPVVVAPVVEVVPVPLSIIIDETPSVSAISPAVSPLAAPSVIPATPSTSSLAEVEATVASLQSSISQLMNMMVPTLQVLTTHLSPLVSTMQMMQNNGAMMPMLSPQHLVPSPSTSPTRQIEMQKQ